jgi:DNA segregation ATPase FtsK/SpoIIIE, S-DNA-T family
MTTSTNRVGQAHARTSTAGAQPGRFLVHRPVRAHPPPLPAVDLTVAAPPTVGGTTSSLAGWLQYLVPLAGSGGSVAFLFAFPGPRPAWLVALVIGAAGASVAAGLALRLLERRANRRARRRERTRYLAHLTRVALQADQLATAQLAVAEHLHPEPSALWSTVDRTDRLWERRPTDDDFLTVRIGRGPVPLAAPARLDASGGPLMDYDPDLLRSAETLTRRASHLPDAPVAVPLRQLAVLALTGPPAATRALARSLLCQLATFHAPDDLQLLTVHPPGTRPAWAWAGWFPHARAPTAGDGSPTSGLSGPPASIHLGPPAYVDAGPPASGYSEPRPGRSPHLLAVVDLNDAGSDAGSPEGPEPAAQPGRPGRGAIAQGLLARAAAGGVTVIWLAATTQDEPSELSMRIRLADRETATLLETVAGGRRITDIRADSVDLAYCEAIARRLSPLQLDRPPPPGSRAAGPVRLLDLLARMTDPLGHPHPAALGHRTGPAHPTGLAHPTVGSAAARPIGRRTEVRSRPRHDLLRVPVGVTANGDPLVLDLKEAAEGGAGPHGLVVGATGSGKSELLRTIVAGLAVTHPPDELAFVLVDFKGGAAFADLAPLPHVAGLITNLQSDLSMVDRAMAALQGELARRQQRLRQAGNQPDLRAYAARRAADPRLEPLPHLLIVVDEFGELLDARPGFLDVFTAIGRVGRSLGIHLLLASQRLDEGRLRGLDSHLRFRICLRTFSAAESTAVLGVPDAFHLDPTPGTALIKVDAAQPVPFTAALVSTERLHLDQVPSESSSWSGSARAPTSEASARLERRTDLEIVVDGLAAAGPPVHRVWLPPLAADVALDPLLRDAAPGWLRAPIGVVDRPLDQVQEPLVLDLSGSAGHLAVVGAPRTGKSTLLSTIVAALAATHPPDEVQVYAVDLGGGLLHRLHELPHLGAVCGPREPDRVHQLVRELRSLVLERERRFRDLGVDSMASWHELRRAGLDLGGYGEVFLLIDNWAALVRELPELEAATTELAAVGLHYGVHLVLAANRWAELRPGLRENLGGRLELRLNDPLESELGRSVAASLPELPGRGLTQAGLQFQVALPGPPAAVLERARSDRIGAAAPPLRLLPALVAESDLPTPPGASRSREPAGLPFAVEEHRLETVWLDLFDGAPHLLVLGDAECGRSSLLRLIGRGLATRYPPEEVAVVVVDPRRGLADLATLPNLAGYACTPAAVVEVVDQLHRELADRGPAEDDLPPFRPRPAVVFPVSPGPAAALPVPPGPAVAAPVPPGPAVVLPVPLRPAVILNGSPTNGSGGGSGGPPVSSRPAALTAAPPVGWPVGSPVGSPGLGTPIRAGPRIVLLVDDYDLLPAAGGSSLLPLLDLLGLGRELGFHLVLARRVAGAARAAFEPVFQRLRELGGLGLVMRGDPDEGPLLGGQRAAPLPPGRGFFVHPRRPPTLVQVAYSAPPSSGGA